ncbi:unnamed protein product [Alopecurus aequalis]
MADEQHDYWINLPFDLLEPIAQRSRDAITGFDTFRSVCRTWRSAVRPAVAPRLLLPAPENGAAPRGGSKYAPLVFPLSRGWSIVVDVGDVSCHLKHLPTGATAAMPKINAVRDNSVSEGKIMIECWNHRRIFMSYLDFSDLFKFAIHIPPSTPAASTDGMVIMMHHLIQGNTGMVFCRPGDVAWTKIANPNSEDSFADFAYFEGKMLAVDDKGATLVFDATTLQLLYQIDLPPATPNFKAKIFGYTPDESHCLRLVALPGKVLLVKIRVNSSKAPEGFDVLALSGSGKADGGQAWRKVTGDDIGDSHELFLDCYHATFRDARDGRVIRIYFHDNFSDTVGSGAAYCYNMQDDKLECIYRESEDNRCLYSTRASWFVPTN